MPASGWKSRMQGGLLGIVGFLLSPLSWWNDAFINLPLAMAFGWLAGWFYKPAFEPAVVIGYWLTNILGLVLMQKGMEKALGKGEPRRYSWPAFAKDLAVSFGYTLLILLLIKLKVLQPFRDYFR